jgi:hypothetical protein
MNTSADVTWRFRLGIGVFILSIVTPLVGVPLVTALGLSATKTTTLSGVLLVGAEVLGILAVAIMGKEGYSFLKQRVLGFIKRHGPPQTVSKSRYTIGLILFLIPILFGWLSIYVSQYIPYYQDNTILFALGGDIVFILSFFVLGGDFWDKIRGLFIYNARVKFSS